MSEDEQRYQSYLERAVVLGAIEPGGYGKFDGKLVRKLNLDEFRERIKEYDALVSSYEKIVQNGHTLSNTLIRVLRERAAELLVQSPA
jgi:hypothetical protein